MISLETLLFPDTDIFRDKLYPLLLFCKPMHYLQPVEVDENNIMENENDIFMDHGLCQGHTPAPLGNDQQRFLQLVTDIKTRKDDYAAQLSALTMAAMSAPKSEKKGESGHDIVSSLLKGHNLSPALHTTDTDLWQARLVLAIAEILDREEEELYDELQLLDTREIDMLRTLQGGDVSQEEEPLAELDRIREHLTKPRAKEVKKRFAAWLRLIRVEPLAEKFLWVASSDDAADQVIHEYEKRSDMVITPLLKLPLPGKIMVSVHHLVDQLENFHHAAADIHNNIKNDLARLSKLADFTSGDLQTLLPHGTDWVEQWERLLEDHFPQSSHGRSFLTLYLLPNTSLADLFSLAGAENTDPSVLHAILGVHRR